MGGSIRNTFEGPLRPFMGIGPQASFQEGKFYILAKAFKMSTPLGPVRSEICHAGRVPRPGLLRSGPFSAHLPVPRTTSSSPAAQGLRPAGQQAPATSTAYTCIGPAADGTCFALGNDQESTVAGA